MVYLAAKLFLKLVSGGNFSEDGEKNIKIWTFSVSKTNETKKKIIVFSFRVF